MNYAACCTYRVIIMFACERRLIEHRVFAADKRMMHHFLFHVWFSGSVRVIDIIVVIDQERNMKQ